MKRSKFSLSYTKLLSCDMGWLVPIGLTEVLPGDSFQHATSLLVRVSPLLSPVMHPVRVRIHHWFVPHRLVWEDWEDFITGGPDGNNNASVPYFNTAAVLHSPHDYYGIPNATGATRYSALPMRGYNLIWNEWYRDQDLNPERVVAQASGLDSTSSISMAYVNWEKDRFTSARPWPQKGPDVTLPLGTTAPVVSTNTMPTMKNVSGAGATQGLHADSTGFLQAATGGTSALPESDLMWVSTGMRADLTSATSATVNALREAMALQRYAEARARYGSRYTEYLRYLGVRSSDARLQRPEYLGGGRQVIQFSEVLQTGPGETDQVGALKGHGIGAMRSNRYRRFFEEHGYVHSLMSVVPKTMYMQGLAKHWTRANKEDFWQRELQHIGQAEIFNKEIYAASATPEAVFGWQDRYDEYRREESGVAAEFRTILNHWHYAREFAAEPVLNSSFVRADPTKRVNAVQTNDVLWVMANHSLQARRMVASQGTSFIF